MCVVFRKPPSCHITDCVFFCCCRQQGALEQAAVSAQRQADDLRSRLADAQSKLQLAQAAADAAAQERAQLLQQVAQELNRASLVEQVRS
jgi:hypothetical protein